MSQKSVKYGDFVLTALFAAIIFVLMLTPIGFINLVIIKATIVHVPVIIGSIVLGPRKGAVLGAIFGLSSFFVNTMTPSLLSFAFSPLIPVPGTASGSAWAVLICFVPRIMVGVVPYYVYKLCQKLMKNNSKLSYFSLAISGIFGSFTNTILVMGLIFVLFKDAYAMAKGIDPSLVGGVVMGVVGANGVPEALVAMVAAAAICKPLLKLRTRMVGSSIKIEPQMK